MIKTLWPRVQNYLEQALVRGHSDYGLDYIHQRLLLNQSLLWLATSGNSILGAATTEIDGLIGTEHRVCVITALGGRNFEEWKHFVRDLEEYARRENCVLMRLYGRHGWIRMLRDDGYIQPWVALEKRL